MGSWGRHGWPRKDEEMRIYRERDGSHLIMMMDDESRGNYGAVANVLDGPRPSLGYTSVSRNYTYEKGCKRVQWSELPDEWQRAFTKYLHDADDESPFDPNRVRGFWLVENFPKQPA